MVLKAADVTEFAIMDNLGSHKDGRDQKPCIGFDGGGCHRFGAGAWPAYF